MTRSAMVASTLGVEFVSYSNGLFWPPCRANFCISAAQLGTFLGNSWHRIAPGSGLSWVLATPDRVAWWHGDCAIAGGADGCRDHAQSRTEAIG
jgi:hypothetical protein